MDKAVSPHISVIMPVYNSAPYLRQAIDSILNQTYRDFEFLIFNDGSTDKSLDIINSYNDTRIKVFSEAKNKGLIYWLNFGIKAASGTLIARMDSDDIAISSRFTKQIKVFEEHPEIGVCGSNIQLLQDNKKGMTYHYPEFDTDIKSTMLFLCPIAHPTVMYRKNLFSHDKDLYQDRTFPAEDYDLWYRLLNKTSFYNIQQNLLLYRVSQQQISNLLCHSQREKSETVHYAILADLGISNDKIKHFQSIIREPWEQTSAFLTRFADCALNLKTANESSSYLNQHAFNKKLASEYWNRCFFASTRSCDGFQMYKQNLLSAYYRPPFVKKLKAYLKTKFVN